MAEQKIPIQIRLALDEVALLDNYVESFADFPPTRVAVVHRALREWLTAKTTGRQAGPVVPSVGEVAGHEAAPVVLPVDPAASPSPGRAVEGVDPEPLEALPPAPPGIPPSLGRASDAAAAPRPMVPSDADAPARPARRATRPTQVKKKGVRAQR